MISGWPLPSTLMQWQTHAPPVNNKQMEKEKGEKCRELIEILSGGISVGKRKRLLHCLQKTEDPSCHQSLPQNAFQSKKVVFNEVATACTFSSS